MSESEIAILNFVDVERDIEKWYDALGKISCPENEPLPISRYDASKEAVLNQYLQKGHYDSLITFVLKGYKSQELIEDLTLALLQNQDSRRLNKLWNALSLSARTAYMQLNAVKVFFPTTKLDANGLTKLSAEEVQKEHFDYNLPRAKAEAIGILRRYESISLALGNSEKILTKIRKDIVALETGITEKIRTKPDPRSMNDEIFWELIENSRTEVSIPEQTQKLTEQLEQFAGKEILHFEKLLHEKLNAAYRWDVWALAYLAQNGCSDDSFEFFRAWLLFQGRQIFQNALDDINLVLKDVPSGLGTQAEELFSCAPIAYENRTGKPMPMKIRKLPKLQGISWNEENVSMLFPEIAKFYAE